MSSVYTVFKNSLTLATANLVSKIITIFFLAIVANRLGANLYGLFTFAFAYISLFSGLTDFGVSDLMVREVARNRALVKKYLENCLVIKAVLILFTAIIVAITIPLLGKGSQASIVLGITFCILVVTSVTYVMRSILFAWEDMNHPAIGDILERIVTFVFGTMVLLLGFSIVALLFVLLAGILVKLSYFSWIINRSIVKLSLHFDRKFAFDTLRLALPFALGIFVGTIYSRVNIVLLSMIRGNEAVGLFGAAYDKILGFATFGVMISQAVFPTLSRVYIEAIDEAKSIYRKIFQYVYIVSIPIVVGIIITADKIIHILHTPEYEPSILALCLLAPYVTIKLLYYGISIVLTSINRQQQRVMIEAAACFVFIAMNVILIYRFSFIGACIATVGVEFLLLAALYLYISRHFTGLPLLEICLKPTLIVALMGVVAYGLRPAPFLVQVVVSAGVYVILIYLTGGIREDWKKLLERFQLRSTAAK
jgi:O-antigen/teichoic acid export membrane protein